MDELEEILISSDVGVDTTLRIIERIEKRVLRDKYLDTKELNEILKEEISELLLQNEAAIQHSNWDPKSGMPFVIMVVGVNGVGNIS